ncbi:methionine synthase, partial [Acetobacter sp. DmW_125133]
MSLKNRFGNIKADYASFHPGGLLLMVSEPPLWHIDAAGRPSTPSG